MSRPIFRLDEWAQRLHTARMATQTVPAIRDRLPAEFFDEIQAIEEESQATAFGSECAARAAELAELQKEQKRVQRIDDVTTEILQAVASAGAGSLSTVQLGGVSVGGGLNWLLGVASKAGCLYGFENRALRVACRTGKTLLHSQLAIEARKFINGA